MTARSKWRIKQLAKITMAVVSMMPMAVAIANQMAAVVMTMEPTTKTQPKTTILMIATMAMKAKARKMK